MGSGESLLSAEQLDEYAELTYLTRWEVLLILKKLQVLAPDGLARDLHMRFSCRKIMDVFPQLKVRYGFVNLATYEALQIVLEFGYSDCLVTYVNWISNYVSNMTNCSC